MSSALNPTRASRSVPVAASTDAGAAAPAQERPVATVVTAVLQDSVAVATVSLCWLGRQQNVGYKQEVRLRGTTPPQ